VCGVVRGKSAGDSSGTFLGFTCLRDQLINFHILAFSASIFRKGNFRKPNNAILEKMQQFFSCPMNSLCPIPIVALYFVYGGFCK